MKLFALKDKNTGEWLEGSASKTRMTAYEDEAECEKVKDYFPERETVTVTLRVEPTTLCEKCINEISEPHPTKHHPYGTWMIRPNFCSNCERSLNDENRNI